MPVNAATYVFGYAALLRKEETHSMEAYADALYEATDDMAVCVVMDSLEGEDVQNYAIELFNAWGIEDAERNDGLLLLFQRRTRSSA